MASSRDILIAGAGIGGLTAALALARRGFRAVVLEQAAGLDEAGAGIQLSPNATRILEALGLGAALGPRLVAPEEVRIMTARSLTPIARIPLGAYAAGRYGAPYWSLHRGDLQQALRTAAEAHPDITLKLGTKVEDFALYPGGVTIAARRGAIASDERGLALIGADGLWSTLRKKFHSNEAPRFASRVAWRAVVPAAAIPEIFRASAIHLWLGREAHLVHYPVRGGDEINIVMVLQDREAPSGWSAPRSRGDLMARISQSRWPLPVRALLDVPDRWLTWALYDRPPVLHWGHGPVTFVGDAAHPMLPFLAQGAAMAIEDAAVLASHLGEHPDEPRQALRVYEAARQERTARAQRAARRNRRLYHLGTIPALVRNLTMRIMGGERLLHGFDWLYGWKAE